jgi:hypothetical protein
MKTIKNLLSRRALFLASIAHIDRLHLRRTLGGFHYFWMSLTSPQALMAFGTDRKLGGPRPSRDEARAAKRLAQKDINEAQWGRLLLS